MLSAPFSIAERRKIMSNLAEYAKSEMEWAWPEKKDEHGNLIDPMQELVKKDVLQLIEVFSEQNHSGFSAPYVLQIFDRLSRWLPICPLTGDEDEWNEPWYLDGQSHQQNKRCGSVFRYNFDNSTAYNSEGKVFVDKNGISYTCADSRVPIAFPYEVPDKPEYVKDYEE